MTTTLVFVSLMIHLVDFTSAINDVIAQILFCSTNQQFQDLTSLISFYLYFYEDLKKRINSRRTGSSSHQSVYIVIM